MSIKKLIFFGMFFCVFCFAPVFGDDVGAAQAPKSDTEEVDEIDESNSEYYDVLSVVEELDWCPEDGSAPNSTRKAEICKMVSEISGLEDELAANTKDLEENYQNMKDKETSLENRLLGAAGMATVGIGGMMAASALSEQSADAAAESDMTAYLQTFQCKIGDKRFRGGEMGVGTGTGNELIELYQQYVDLAADLKERKAALGIKAGIESEVIMDKANAGLYDDTGKGIENGTYASLYRASKGNDTDKSKFDDAKDTSANRVKYGGVAAGVGAVGGLIGNAIINDDDDDDENVTESDCKKAGGTFKDKKCTCKDKNKKYKNGKCVNKSDSDSGLDLGAIGASLGSNLGSGAAGLLQGVAGGDGGGAAQLLQGVAGGGNAAGVLQNAGSLLGQ